jgi:Zn ribbon nucleic-acid-binding protein
MTYTLTDKSKALIQTKTIDGNLYALCDIVDGKELWLLVSVPENPKCAKCGYDGPALDKHHIYGRKNSDETIYLCANCHREYHMKWGYK